MFRSRLRPIVYPQFEHSRFSACIAQFWGNADFETPNFDQSKLLSAIAFHDRGYDPIDDQGIGEISPEQWLALQKRGVEMSSGDPIVDVLIMMHLLRLVEHRATPRRRDYAETIRQEIEQIIKSNQLEIEQLLFADQIMQFCDKVSFDFCFETPTSGVLEVSPKPGENSVEIRYEILANNQLAISPWPLSQPEIKGFLVAYEAEDYPMLLRPVLVQYRITKS